VRFDLITIFPEMAEAVTGFGVTGRALQKGLWQLRRWNPRDHTSDPWRRVDDRPYGGGPGMVMLAQPLIDTLKAIRSDRAGDSAVPVVCLSPQGRPFSDRMARDLARSPGVILIAGRYEAIDQRFIDSHVDAEWSVGDFVVSGGELPAMMVIDAAVRYLPGALNDPDSAHQDSFAGGLLDCPHYTRPESLEGLEVPDILLSGHHARIAQWRREQALRVTCARRPDLIDRARREGLLTPSDEAILQRTGADDPSV
jgi:tRNA (guanine37-N1)-methyltransferase